MYICFNHRSSGGAKGDSESEADPFVQPKISNNLRYANYCILLFKILFK